MCALIGLSGYARSGKDSVGQILVENYGFTRTAFADRMKEIALAINPIIDWSVSVADARPVRLDEVITAVGWERAKQNREVRELLQRIGTEAGRKFLGQDVWVDATFRFMSSAKPDKWALTDVRFPNEVDAVHSHGGVIVRIDRTGIDAPNDHISEHALDGFEFDLWLHNDGTLEELNNRVDDLIVDLANQAALDG